MIFSNDICITKLVSILIFSISLYFIACSNNVDATEEEYKAVGRIVDVESYSLKKADKITIHLGDNLIEDYFIKTYLEEFTPSHIREHMLTGEPVKVFYYVLGDKNIVNHIEDYEE